MVKYPFFGVVLLAAAASQQANASNYGCAALLCFAAPMNPMSISECVPTVKRVFRDLFKGRGFPHCSMSSGGVLNTASTDVKVQQLGFPDCPADYISVPAGARVRAGSAPFIASEHSGIKACGKRRILIWGQRNTTYVFQELMWLPPKYQIDVFVDGQLQKSTIGTSTDGEDALKIE